MTADRGGIILNTK